jgi:hypothetical protein
VQAIDQMKPTISRAMATFTTLAVLPRARSRRYRAQRLASVALRSLVRVYVTRKIASAPYAGVLNTGSVAWHERLRLI